MTRPVLRYHGGKFRIAPWIISNLPLHRIYVEPFGGAASVLMRKPRSYAEIYNDLQSDVVGVFRILRDPDRARRLAELLRLTPFAREEFALTSEAAMEGIGDELERARLTILRSLGGFGRAASNPRQVTGFRADSNRSGTTPAHDWANYPAHIAAFTTRLQGVVVENRPARDVMLAHDGPQTLHYVDPPYVQGTRSFRSRNQSYQFEMTDTDHEELAGTLHGLRGMVVLSGYRSELYGRLYPDWVRVDRSVFADGAQRRVESLWLNPSASQRGQGNLGLEGVG